MFHKAFKTNTGNGLGSFLESFYIMEEKKKKKKREEPFSYVQFRETAYSQYLTLSFTTLLKPHTEEN